MVGLEWSGRACYPSSMPECLSSWQPKCHKDEGNGWCFCWWPRCRLSGHCPWAPWLPPVSPQQPLTPGPTVPLSFLLHLEAVSLCLQEHTCLPTGSLSYSSALSPPQNESPDTLKCLIILWLIDSSVASLENWFSSMPSSKGSKKIEFCLSPTLH